MDIKSCVCKLIRKHGSNNPFELCDKLGIIVRYAELGNTWGFFFTYKRIPIIHINQNLSEELKTFTCAHELGHSQLHKGISTPFLKAHTLFSIDKIERQANTFAVELLLPDDFIRENRDCSIQCLGGLAGIPAGLETLKIFRRC